MNNINDILEACLQRLENGADLETLLSSYPEQASELRPILDAAVRAREMIAPAPSEKALRRGRAKFMQRAAELRELKVAPRKRAFPVFQRVAVTLTLTALFLASGTGLVGASSSALPGENLYPVKRSWEGLRLIFTFNEEFRENLEYEFENERLEEVGELIAEGRHETIQFAGVFMDVNGVTYISGVQVVITETTQLPPQVIVNGAAVIITGHTNAEGFVEAESIELLPTGTVVPAGSPVEVESEKESEQEKFNSSNSSSGSESETDGDKSGGDEMKESNSGSGNSEDKSGSGSGGPGDDDHSGSGGGGGGEGDDDDD